ncbi:MAG: TonB-dependent receptor [Bacteroidia bacterium]|nr:TonB-dependent receptor [Bacteroidia bacterium]
MHLPLAAQTISGVISDETGQPLIGAAVKLQGTSIGAATDLQGKFSFKPGKTGKVTLEVSFMGYTKEYRSLNLVAGKDETVNLSLKPNVKLMNEVVVVGYGVQRKREVTGSIVSISGKDLTELPTPSFENGLQGKASGLQVITGSGAAGSSSVIRIRGVASASAGGDPLYVVDGIPITQDYFLNGNSGGQNNNPLASIAPSDIESVEVLKDAAATGIYGSRGANGVILITTKRGKKKGFHVDLSTRQGVSTPTALPNMMNNTEFLQMYEEAYVNDGRLGVPALPGNISWEDARRTNTDWVKEAIGVGYQQNTSLSMGKGADNYNIFGSFAQQNDKSYMLGNAYNRTSGRVNGDYKFAKWGKVSLGTSLSQGTNLLQGMGWSGGLGAAMSTALPIYPIYYEKDVLNDDGLVIHKAGDYFLPSNDISRNPVAMRELRDWRSRETRTLNNISLEIQPIKDLYIRGTGSLDYMAWRQDEYQKAGYDANNPLLTKAYRRSFDVANFNMNLVANYLKTLKEKHDFNFMLGTEYQDSKTKHFSSTKNETSATGYLSSDDPLAVSDNNAKQEEWNFISYFGRVKYSYKKRYLAELVGRRDGSSKFGKNNKYGFFPSASLGWILSEEAFLKGNKIISFLKVRSSYGLTGNSNIPAYAQYNVFYKKANAYNGETIFFPDAASPSNPDLKWETNLTFDAALEFGLLNDRISGDIGIYNKDTRDMLLYISAQNNTGFTNAWANVGKVNNRGIEFSLKAHIIDRKFKWNVDFTIARNVNELTSLGDYTEDAVSGGTNDTRLVVGRPIGNNYLVQFSHVDPANGKPVYFDKNGNETYTWDVANRVSAGSILPDAFGSVKNDFRYGPFDLSMFWVFVLGGDIYDSSSKRQLGTFDTDGWNHRTDQFDRWRQPGDEAKYPLLTTSSTAYGSGTPWINTTLWVHDGTFARLRSLSIGYTFPAKMLEKSKLGSARISLVGTNLITLTKFPGLDPEIARDFENATDRNMSPNITYLTSPQQKTFSISVDIGF